MSTVFFTGFPGFLGVQLLPRVLHGTTDRARCLVEPRFAGVAARRVAALEHTNPDLEGRIDIVEGDITRPGLGLSDPAGEALDVRAVFHLAAVYDLSVGRDLGVAVNVEGTRNVLDFAETAPGLERVHYVSTCYVSGRWTGIFREDDLDKGQRFNNFYEETKFLAEIEVRLRMAAGLPCTIYRPSVVTGDSTTGATQKYDGPYYIIRWLLKQPRVAVLPVIGDTTMTRLNLVPRDFAIDALDHLVRHGEAGVTYALADPEPLTVAETIQVFSQATGRRIVQIPLPLGVAKSAIVNVPGVYQVLEIPAAAIDYFRHPTHYDTSRATAALDGTGIAVPPLRSYARHLVEFVKAHPRIDVQLLDAS